MSEENNIFGFEQFSEMWDEHNEFCCWGLDGLCIYGPYNKTRVYENVVIGFWDYMGAQWIQYIEDHPSLVDWFRVKAESLGMCPTTRDDVIKVFNHKRQETLSHFLYVVDFPHMKPTSGEGWNGNIVRRAIKAYPVNGYKTIQLHPRDVSKDSFFNKTFQKYVESLRGDDRAVLREINRR